MEIQPWHIGNVIACLQSGAGWIHDKDLKDLTLADLIVKMDIDKAPMTLGGVPIGPANFAEFPFESRGEARKGIVGVKINGNPVAGMDLSAPVADLFADVIGDAWDISGSSFGMRVALISFGKKFRSVVVVF